MARSFGCSEERNICRKNKMDDITNNKSLIEEMKSDPSGKMKPFLMNRLRVPEYVLEKCTLDNVVFLSAKEGFGIEDLESKVSNAFSLALSSVEGDAYFVSSRQSEALKHAVEAMERERIRVERFARGLLDD